MILVVAYLLPLVLLTLLLLRCPLSQPARVALLLALPLFYIGHYLGLETLPGWPVPAPPPDGFVLLGERIEQPDKASGNPGRIELWALPPGSERSRLYELPYSRDLHEELVKARQRSSDGHPQQGRRRQGGTVANRENRDIGGTWRFEDAPRKRLPPKG